MSMGKIKLFITYEELYKLYILEEYSSKDIAIMYNVTDCTILNKLKYYNIKSRGFLRTNKTKQKISLLKFGNTPWNKGLKIKFTEEHCNNISKSMKGKHSSPK